MPWARQGPRPALPRARADRPALLQVPPRPAPPPPGHAASLRQRQEVGNSCGEDRAGVPDAVAASVMGHADTRILARYQNVVSELQRDAAARVETLLGGV